MLTKVEKQVLLEIFRMLKSNEETQALLVEILTKLLEEKR